jgi:hypothetical protein
MGTVCAQRCQRILEEAPNLITIVTDDMDSTSAAGDVLFQNSLSVAYYGPRSEPEGPRGPPKTSHDRLLADLFSAEDPSLLKVRQLTRH